MSNEYTNRRSNKRQAFTLVEILVALGIMMILMVIILVPINMALSVFHIGKARNELQQANKIVLGQLASELRQAIHVFPNEQMPGITDKAPYTNNGQKPYYNKDGPGAVNNTSRLDFLLPAQTSNGTILTPARPRNYIVTYYARRLKPLLDDGTTDNPYDVYSNPIMLFRAQYPYKQDDGTAFSSFTATNTNLTNTRYPIGTSPYAGKVWLLQTAKGEPNLADLATYSSSTVASSHTLITPRDMSLYAPSATATTPNYQPDSSFTCDDVNTDGKIDRVTINLHLVKYDSIGANPNSQKLRLTQTVDLPNVK